MAMANKPRDLTGVEYFPVNDIRVAEFHEDPAAGDDATAVLLIFKVGGASREFIMRLKSKASADELIVALMTHSKAVWPD